jgi:hypothetical protein
MRPRRGYQIIKAIYSRTPPNTLQEAVRDLKAALFDVLLAASDEKQRMAEILRRVRAEIVRR